MASEKKIDLFRELGKTEYAQPGEPRLVDVEQGLYLAIDGQGAPGGEAFEKRVGALYALAYTVKMTRKFEGRQDYVMGKLEGLWWSDYGPDLKDVPRDEWRWKLMIRTPDVVTEEEVETAAARLLEKGKSPEVQEVRLSSLAEGTSVQMLHVGSYEDEWRTLARMLEFAREQGYSPHGHHHEIYLSDPRRVPPERLRTILRMPVKKSGG